jgi:hypothetical protein
MAKRKEEAIEGELVQEAPQMSGERDMVVADKPSQIAEYGSPLDMPVEVFKQGLSRRGDNRKALVEWVRDSLVEGVDFGRIHTAKNCKDARSGCADPSHFSKPSLWKPGSEKIIGMMGVTATFPSLLEYEKAAYSGVAIQDIILRCEIVDSRKHVVASGVGGRSLDKDYGDLNKCLKMVAKSAAIDATLRLAGLSEVFTQDIEDMVLQEAAEAHSKTSAPQTSASKPKTPPAQSEGPPTKFEEVEAVIALAFTIADLKLAGPLAARLPTEAEKGRARALYQERGKLISPHEAQFLDCWDQIRKADTMDRLEKIIELTLEMPEDMQEFLAKRCDERAITIQKD